MNHMNNQLLVFSLFTAFLIGSSGCSSLGKFSINQPPGPDSSTAVASSGGETPLTPTQVEFHLAQAQVAERQDNLDGAEEVLTSVLKRNGNVPRALHRMAVVLDKKGQPDRSQPYYQQALEALPHNSELLCDYGYSKYLQGDHQAAEKYYQASIGADPRNQRAHNNLGQLLARTNRPKLALRHFEFAGCDEKQAKSNLEFAVSLQQQHSRATSIAKHEIDKSDHNMAVGRGHQQPAPSQIAGSAIGSQQINNQVANSSKPAAVSQGQQRQQPGPSQIATSAIGNQQINSQVANSSKPAAVSQGQQRQTPAPSQIAMSPIGNQQINNQFANSSKPAAVSQGQQRQQPAASQIAMSAVRRQPLNNQVVPVRKPADVEQKSNPVPIKPLKSKILQRDATGRLAAKPISTEKIRPDASASMPGRLVPTPVASWPAAASQIKPNGDVKWDRQLVNRSPKSNQKIQVVNYIAGEKEIAVGHQPPKQPSNSIESAATSSRRSRQGSGNSSVSTTPNLPETVPATHSAAPSIAPQSPVYTLTDLQK